MVTLNETIMHKDAIRYVIDSPSLEENFSFLGHEKYFGTVHILDTNELSLLTLVDSDSFNIVNIVLIGSILLNMVILFYLYIEKMNFEIKIKKIIGYSNKLILLMFMQKFSIFLVLGLGLGSVNSLVISSYLWNIQSINLLHNLTLSVLVFILFGTITSNYIKTVKNLTLEDEL